MRHFIFTLLFGLSLMATVMAQPGDRSKFERIEALNAEFLTKNLDLNKEEAQGFWPVYNTYRQEMNKLFRERHAARKRAKEEGGQSAVNGLNFETRMLETKKRYLTQFYQVLPKNKADRVYPAEREFREHLINQLKERREKRD
jgi:hypothetical protein